MTDEIRNIIDKAKAEGSYLKAPSGKKTKLTSRQWAQVRTRAFKNWFGDWENDPEHASKVLDSNGEPLVVYHGTIFDFDTFESSHVGRSGFPDTQVGEAYFFTTNKLTALAVATYGEHMGSEHLMPVFLNIRDLSWFDPTMWGDADTLNTEGMANLIENGKNIGRDGILYKSKKMGDTYVVFKPNQIKSAEDNNGNFDPKKNSIRESTLLAPNGKPSNLNDKQWHQVRTPEFKAWFGDWENDPQNASKVLDANGEPLVVYHGSKSPSFDTFKMKNSGIFFSDSSEVAGSYAFNDSSIARFNGDKGYVGGSVYPVFLNIRNLDEFDAKGASWRNIFNSDLEERHDVFVGRKLVGMFSHEEQDDYDALIRKLENEGIEYKVDSVPTKFGVYTNDYVINPKLYDRNIHDGLVFKNIVDTVEAFTEKPSCIYVVTDSPNQIKSALDNNGDFNPMKTSIRESALIAPNGQSSNLTEEQWHMVRTPQFKAWFGDWENGSDDISEIIDENGEPLIVYHGTDADFDSFDKSYIGTANDDGYFGKGFYFSASKTYASMYGEVRSFYLNLRNTFDYDHEFGKANYDSEDKGSFEVLNFYYNVARVLPSVADFEIWHDNTFKRAWTPLDIRNLIDEEAKVSDTPFANIVAKHTFDGLIESIDSWDYENRLPEDFSDSLKTLGYDGIIAEGGNEIVAFEPNQIKSATDNNGNFNNNSNNIKESTDMIENLNQTIYARLEGIEVTPSFAFDFDNFRYGYVSWECNIRKGTLSYWEFNPEKGDDVNSDYEDRTIGKTIEGGWLKGVIEISSSAMENMTERDFAESLADYLQNVCIDGEISARNAKVLSKGMIHIGGWDVKNDYMFTDFGNEINYDYYGDCKILEAMIEAPEVTECITELKLLRRESTRRCPSLREANDKSSDRLAKLLKTKVQEIDAHERAIPVAMANKYDEATVEQYMNYLFLEDCKSKNLYGLFKYNDGNHDMFAFDADKLTTNDAKKLIKGLEEFKTALNYDFEEEAEKAFIDRAVESTGMGGLITDWAYKTANYMVLRKDVIKTDVRLKDVRVSQKLMDRIRKELHTDTMTVE